MRHFADAMMRCYARYLMLLIVCHTDITTLAGPARRAAASSMPRHAFFAAAMPRLFFARYMMPLSRFTP